MTLLVLLSFFIHADNNILVLKSSGVAMNEKGDVAYLEKHTIKMKGFQILNLKTEYSTAEKKSFGVLESDFTKNENLPDYTFSDSRYDVRAGSVLDTEQKFVTAYGKGSVDKEVEKKKFKVTDKLLTGQGLHSYITRNMKMLMGLKKPHEIQFLIPLRMDTYSFRIRNHAQDEINKTVTFRIEFDSWFMRLLAPSIDVQYNYENRRLMMFHGPSNIVADRGKIQTVKIKYKYE